MKKKEFFKKIEELLSNNKYDLVIEKLLEVKDKYNNVENYHYFLGFAYEQKKEYIKAIKEYERELKISKNNIQAELGLGRIYARQGGYDEAIKHFNRVIEIDPTNVEAVGNRKLAKVLKERLEKIDKEIIRDYKSENLNPSTISLCMIVKDEEETIGKCLSSVKNIVDEIIVVDTGSNDKTIEIAKSYGAKVYHYKWNEDFSEARNEALKYATCEWILSLDGDEWVDEENAKKIKLLTQMRLADGYVLTIINEQSKELSVIYKNALIRLFRNLPGVKFEGRIHEQITNSFNKLKLKIKFTDAVIYHSGYQTTVVSKKKKIIRNLRIMKKILKKEPDNYFIHYSIGSTYSASGNYALAIKYYNKVINRLDAEYHIRRQSWLDAIVCLKNNKKIKKCYEYLNEAIKIYPTERILYVIRGEIYGLRGKYEYAIKDFETALKLKYENPFGSLYIEDAHINALIAQSYEKIGKYEIAEKYYNEAIKLKNNWHFYAALGNLYFTQEKISLAIECYKKALKINHLADIVWQNLGSAYIKLQDYDNALFCLTEAIRINKKNYEAYRLKGIALINIDRISDAIILLKQAMKLNPKEEIKELLFMCYKKLGKEKLWRNNG